MKNRLIPFFLLYFIFPFYCYSAEPIKVQLLSTVDTVGNENFVTLGLYFDMDPEWKIYAPSENLSAQLGYPPKIEWNYLKNVQDVQVHWPIPEIEKWNDYASAIYRNSLIVPLTVQLNSPSKAIELNFTLHFLACNQTCLPISKHFSIELKEGVATETPHASEIYKSMVPQRLNFALMIILAILGGIILNVMPCVLPVLGLKLLNLTKNRDPESISKSALNVFSGIIFSFLLMALFILSIRQLGIKVGWGFHFQNMYFLMAIMAVMFVFSLNLFGVFEFRLLAFLQRFVASSPVSKDPSYIEDFLSGVLATLLSTPCSAPFLGTAVSYALTMGGVYILVIFLSLGIGFGLPYFLMAALPLKHIPLPRPGNWMIRLRQLLGFFLLLTSIWLGVIVMKQLGFQSAFDGSFSAAEQLEWKEFDETAIDKHVQQGRLVFVDVTADWCMTCIYNDTFILKKSKLKKILQHPKVVLMRGNWTKRDEKIYDFLKKNNRYGVPFNKIYGPHCKNGIDLPELLNQKNLIAAFEKCGLPPSM